MFFYLKQFVATLLFPLNSSLILILLGLILLRYFSSIGKVLITISFINLWLFSTPIVALHLTDHLQNQYPFISVNKLIKDPSAAIVVLEGGLNTLTPEYENNPTVSESTLARIRYAAYLHKKMGTPILVSGNDQNNLQINQAECMANSLIDYFGVPTCWKESNGYNTAQEGLLSVDILKKSGIKKIYLVTHALHMPRAVYSFQNKGIDIIPAPTGFKEQKQVLGKLSYFLPSIEALQDSTAALHEYIGILWYRMYYHF